MDILMVLGATMRAVKYEDFYENLDDEIKRETVLNENLQEVSKAIASPFIKVDDSVKEMLQGLAHGN